MFTPEQLALIVKALHALEHTAAYQAWDSDKRYTEDHCPQDLEDATNAQKLTDDCTALIKQIGL
jgi:hypothetical protein